MFEHYPIVMTKSSTAQALFRVARYPQITEPA
ncbi:MAG: hypothetical protein JWP11_1234 [Frankiales bacterium]|nr:hypothetical protein [Frankiales bacterium]